MPVLCPPAPPKRRRLKEMRDMPMRDTALLSGAMNAGSGLGVSQMGTHIKAGLQGGTSAVEQMMLDQSDRVLRQPAGRMAMVLHLARIRPPGARPHHAAIARAILEEAAKRQNGQVFPLRDGDIVLLCAASTPSQGDDFVDSLSTLLISLFGAGAADDPPLVSHWWLDHQGEGYRQYLAARVAGPPAATLVAEPETGGEIALATWESALTSCDLIDLLSTQTAIHLHAGKHLPLIARLSPLFRDLDLSLLPTGGLPSAGDPPNDPYLSRYLAARLESRLLVYLTNDMLAGGRLTRAARSEHLAIHFSLTLSGVISAEFARFTRTAATRLIPFGIKIRLIDALRDLELTAHAIDLIRLARCELVLEGIDYAALQLLPAQALQPDLVRLEWSPRLEAAGEDEGEAINRALEKWGTDRVVLTHTDTEHALIWGQSHGIQRFQGTMIETVRAAARMAECDCARACTLRQCATRAAVFSAAGRAGCGNPALLDTNPMALDSHPRHAT